MKINWNVPCVTRDSFDETIKAKYRPISTQLDINSRESILRKTAGGDCRLEEFNYSTDQGRSLFANWDLDIGQVTHRILYLQEKISSFCCKVDFWILKKLYLVSETWNFIPIFQPFANVFSRQEFQYDSVLSKLISGSEIGDEGRGNLNRWRPYSHFCGLFQPFANIWWCPSGLEVTKSYRLSHSIALQTDIYDM